MNNYLEWSKEYRAEADKMLSVVDKYKSMLKTKSLLNKRKSMRKFADTEVITLSALILQICLRQDIRG